MPRFTHALKTVSALALMAAAPAVAQQAEGENSQDHTVNEDAVQILSTWSYDRLYEDGWSVENMFNTTELTDANGEVIGDVENVIFSNDGEVLGVIAQVGGFWDIGDTHVHVPWDEVSVGDTMEQVQVPVTEDTVDDYDVFGGMMNEETLTQDDTSGSNVVNDDLAAGENIFKATDLMGDYAYLADNVRYGYVADLIIQDGAISAVVSDAASYGRSGYYAYPYEEGRVTPMGGSQYRMPYTQAQIDSIENFDYERLQSRVQ
jgi:sporulation protein YlmC with PRC-barrel domain